MRKMARCFAAAWALAWARRALAEGGAWACTKATPSRKAAKGRPKPVRWLFMPPAYYGTGGGR
jgi:hypothetical protein